MTNRKHPKLLRQIEDWQGEQSWGAVLDAGTGVQSIRWISDLPTDNWTAISASPMHADQVREEVRLTQRPSDQIIVGNWVDPELLKGQIFDTVIADYLLGAVEGFAPYFQPYLFQRLRPLTKNKLYVKGLEPYVPIEPPQTEAGRIIWEIGRHRDACILLGGDVPYREYPALWVVDQLRIAGFATQNLKHFTIKYKSKFVNAQINQCTIALKRLADHQLAEALSKRGEALRTKALRYIDANGSLDYGRNYVIAAEPV